MNKNDLVQAVADEANLSKADAARAVDAVLASVGNALKQGDTVALVRARAKRSRSPLRKILSSRLAKR